jgi:hypothetical protein
VNDDDVRENRWEVRGIVDTRLIHWFVIPCGDSQLSVHRWNSEAAEADRASHFCGAAHAEVPISRWFECRYAQCYYPLTLIY